MHVELLFAKRRRFGYERCFFLALALTWRLGFDDDGVGVFLLYGFVYEE